MDEEAGRAQPGRREPPGDRPWAGADVRALREQLGDSQHEFAERLGTRQQTVSEWERGASRPRRMARRLLTLIAEDAAGYDAGDAAAS